MIVKNGILIKVEFNDIELLNSNPELFWKGISSIGYQAFAYNGELTNITIPNSVTSISEDAFYCCRNLKSITIPDSVTYLGNNAFYNCENLTNITIPDSVTFLGDTAFYNCNNLTNIVIPDSVTSIGDSAFFGCINLTNITLPNSVTEIEKDAFYHCESLENIKIPNSVTIINTGTFQSCKNLKEVLIPDSIISIENFAFSSCSLLKNIVIPNSVKYIEEKAFSHCSSLSSLTLPTSLLRIEAGVFSNCSNLTSVTIPNSVTFIGEEAFSECKNLVNIDMPNSVNYIEDAAFSYCENLTNITIPNSIKSLGEAAFLHCSKLTSITIPESISNLAGLLFCNCISLKSVNLPNTLKSIGDSAFSGCESLENIKIPNSVTKIERNSFNGCLNLTSINIPETIKNIEDGTFYNCKSLKEIILPDSVIEIGSGAFNGCSSLKSVVLPKSIKKIDVYAFYNCENLKEITISDSITEFAKNVYGGIKSITCNGKTLNLHSEFLRSFIEQDKLKNLFENIPQKQINNVMNLVDFSNETISKNNLYDYTNLCSVLGAFEDNDKTMKWNGKDVAVKDIAYTLLQGAKNRGQLIFEGMHMHFQALQPKGFSEEFLKFCLDKNNWNDLCQQPELLPSIYEWYLGREKLDLQENLSDEELPHTEENRYRLLTFKTMENGIDRMKWLTPTVELFKEDFANKKFTGITTTRDKEIANEIALHTIYDQKHFDKAKEIDEERQKLGVSNVIKEPVVQGRIASLEEYKKKTKSLNKHILQSSKEILAKEKEDASHIFTYESLDKSDPVNFAIGCYTSCCAKLYGAGAGAMRAMIIHPDIQPLAIKDFNEKIVSFGIIYVNREEGYAVVNDFEVNNSYSGKDLQRKAIYNKAMEGVKAFVEQYNNENPNRPIRKVTCGCSPNWTAINDFIEKNPKSSILKAPNFDDFKYAGSGSWNGDWHKNQYTLWEEDDYVPSK